MNLEKYSTISFDVFDTLVKRKVRSPEQVFLLVEISLTAQESGKPIYLISDMYLDRNTIEQILLRCGIKGYEKLYISQEEKCEKLGGKLYREVIRRNSINPFSNLHFGDDIKSDILSAKICGLKTRIAEQRNI